jgi:hypothetical protein
MDKIELLKNMIVVADLLDGAGMKKEAEVVDKIMEKVAVEKDASWFHHKSKSQSPQMSDAQKKALQQYNMNHQEQNVSPLGEGTHYDPTLGTWVEDETYRPYGAQKQRQGLEFAEKYMPQTSGTIQDDA